eukprot:g7103.t1
MELSDDEWRLHLIGDVSDLKALNPDQTRILSDKAMNCERGDKEFPEKIGMLHTYWRQHRRGIISLANFHKQVNSVCMWLEQAGQQQQQQGPKMNAGAEPFGGSAFPSGGAASGAGSGGIGGGGAADGGSSIGGGGGAASGAGSAAAQGEGNAPAEDEDDIEDDVTVLAVDQNGAADLGGGDDNDDAGADADAEDAVDPAITKIVNEHIIGGFFEARRWRETRTLVCPGDGYWKEPDDHRILEFRTPTDADLKIAKPRAAPTYIAKNPYCGTVPKRMFNCCMHLYALGKKVAVSALKETRDVPVGLSANTYLKAVQEARRRHDGVVQKRRPREESEDEDEDGVDDSPRYSKRSR